MGLLVSTALSMSAARCKLGSAAAPGRVTCRAAKNFVMRSCSDSSGHVLSACVSWLADMRGPGLMLHSTCLSIRLSPAAGMHRQGLQIWEHRLLCTILFRALSVGADAASA